MARKIMDRIPDEDVKKDLEKYRQRAIDLGATDAKIITTDDVIIDERVVAKCVYPKCPGYGTNANCPPHAMSPEEVRKVISNFRYALFIKLEVPPEHISGREAIDRNYGLPYRRKISEIAARLESEAFHDGYHLALAFAGSTCKSLFCPDNDCFVLSGQGCPHRLKARSPMEAVGMDVYRMATRAGWDIYPIGDATQPSEVPHGNRLALVMIY